VEGVLALDSLSPDAFPDERIAAIKMATHQASMMLTQLREIEQLRRQARDFRNLHEVGRKAGAASRVEEIIGLSLHVIEERLQPEFSAVVLAAGEGGLVVAGVGQPRWEKVKGIRFAPGDGLAGWVLESGSYLACDAQNPPPARPLLAESLEVPRFDRILLHPLKADGSAFGVFVAAGSALALDAASVDFSQAMSQQITFGLMHLKARDRLRALGGIDEHTGLRTRAAFLERVAAEMERVRRYPKPLSLLIVEIDELARLGGACGREGVERAIGEAGAVLRENVRSTDLAAVWGEGRFAVLLTETAPQGSLVQGERLRQLVAGVPLVLEGRRVVLTVSVGVASTEGEEPSFEVFLERAERRCEDARLKGGNRVCGPAGPEPTPSLP
jgi:diguanylate cyclase (GGDEF)-like protein